MKGTRREDSKRMESCPGGKYEKRVTQLEEDNHSSFFQEGKLILFIRLLIAN